MLPPFWSMGNVFWLSKDLHLKPCFHPLLLVQWIKVDQTCLRWILLMSPCMKGTEACHLKGQEDHGKGVVYFFLSYVKKPKRFVILSSTQKFRAQPTPHVFLT